MKVFLLTGIVAIVVATAGSALAAPKTTRLVSTSGTDSGDCTGAPCRTIGYAVGQANAGDTVSVGTGTYAESVAVTKRLALVGHDATIDAGGRSTMLDGNQYYNGVVVVGPGAAGTVHPRTDDRERRPRGYLRRTDVQLTIADNTRTQQRHLWPVQPLVRRPAGRLRRGGASAERHHSTVSGNLVQDNVGGILLTDEDGPTSGEYDQRKRCPK